MDLAEKKRLLLERLKSGAIQLSRPEAVIPRLPAGTDIPLSSAQRRIAFVQQLYPDGCFNGSLVIEHAGDLDLERLRLCLGLVVARHDVLRTVAVDLGAGMAGRVQPPGPIECAFVDVSDAPAETRQQQAVALGRDMVGRPFDIFRESPLIRAMVIRLDPTSSLVVLAMHMFSFDAPSGILFVAELAALYGQPGDPVQLPPLDYQYADYAAWAADRQPATGNGTDEWLRRLAGVAADQQLPTEAARSYPPVFDARRIPFSIPANLERALKALGRKHGATFYIVVLTALKIVLHRHAAADSIAVGAWTTRRNPQNAHLVGPLVNTLVYRTALAPEDTVAAALLKVKREALSAYSHGDLPFERIVQALNPVRDPDANPLFQVHFILQETSDRQQIGQFRLSPLDALIGASGGYDIELIVRDLASGVEGHFEANAQLFDTVQAQRLADRFLAVLEAMVADEQQLVAALPLDHGPAPAAMLPHEVQPLEQALDRILNADLDAVAVHDSAGATTYAELLQLIARLEGWIAAQPDGALIVLAAPPSALLAASMLAALRCGRTFISVGQAPDLSIDVVLAHRGGAAVIAPAAPAGWLADYPCWRPDAEPSRPGVPAPASPAARQAAYLARSSGSTGSGVHAAIPRAGLANLLQALPAAYGLDRQTRLLQTNRAHFDVAIEEFLPVLCAGGQIVVSGCHDQGVHLLSDEIAAHGITHLNMSTALWEAWRDDLCRTGTRPPDSLRVIVIGSEPVSLASIRAWRARFGTAITLINAYGCAEAGITSSLFRIDTATELDRLPRLPIGTPLPGVQLDVVDVARVSVPAAVVGEIAISGPGVALHLESADDALVGRIVERDGQRWLLTGDLGRRRSDGLFEWMARKNQRAKVRGVFVALDEIQARLASHPLVAAAAVSLDGAPPRQQVVARIWWKRAADPDKLTAGQVSARMADWLADHPPTAAGVDRIDVTGAAPAAAPDLSLAALGPQAEALAALWRTLANVEICDPDADLFTLGATSLACLDLASAARVAGLPLTVADLYRHRSLRAQAALLGAVQGG
jgi:non-ribosomal peptide synthetase component F